MKTTAILLAGGHGTRMKNAMAKQYLNLRNKPLILYSYEKLMAMPEIDEIVVVCAPEYQLLFQQHLTKRIAFALPGVRRQDSVYNGFLASSADSRYICVHDGARPFISHEMVVRSWKLPRALEQLRWECRFALRSKRSIAVNM